MDDTTLKIHKLLRIISQYHSSDRVNGNTSVFATSMGITESQFVRILKKLESLEMLGGLYLEGDGFFSIIVYDTDKVLNKTNIPMLVGPISMDASTVREFVWSGMPGYYLLEDKIEGYRVPRYVGRSDSDLQQEMIQRIQMGHPEAEFFYSPSAEQAYYAECALYHAYINLGSLRNERHPDKPDGINVECPYCILTNGESIRTDPNRNERKILELLKKIRT